MKLPLVIAFVFAPLVLPAQATRVPSGIQRQFVETSAYSTLRNTSTAPSIAHGWRSFYNVSACDGSRLRSAASRKRRGIIIGGLGVVVGLASLFTTKTTNTQFGPVTEQSFNTPLLVVGGAAAAYGAYLWGSAAQADDGAFEAATSTFTIGATTQEEVTSCLGNPASSAVKTSNAGSMTVLVYLTISDGRRRTNTITFSRGVLASVERASNQ